MGRTTLVFLTLLASPLLLSLTEGCSQPCSYDTDCESLAICRSGFCTDADTHPQQNGLCQFASDCAPTEFCHAGVCEGRSGTSTPDAGVTDGGGGGTDGGSGLLEPFAWCDVLDPDEVYLVAPVYEVGNALMPVTGDPTEFCVRPNTNSGVIRGSDGRLVARTTSTTNGKAWAFHGDPMVLQTNGHRTVVDPQANDEELPTPPCDTLGELNDLQMNPTTWTTIHRCSPTMPEWYDVNGDPAVSHTLLGFSGSSFDRRSTSSFEITDGSGTTLSFSSADVEGGLQTTTMVRALPDGFLLLTDDGVPRADTGFPSLLAAWSIGLDGVVTKLGTYAGLPTDFQALTGRGFRSVTSAGIFYQIGTLASGSLGIVELRPDGSPATVVYDRDEIEGRMGSGSYWVRISPGSFITGP